MRKRASALNYIVYCIMIILVLIIIYPLFVSLNASLKTTRDIIIKPFELAKVPQFVNYKNALIKGNLLVSYKNSFIITFSSLLLTLIFGSMASFVFAKQALKGKHIIFFYDRLTKMDGDAD